MFNEKMRIVIVTLINPFRKIIGGIDVFTYNLSKALVGLKNKVYILCLDDVKKETIKRIEDAYVWSIPLTHGFRRVTLLDCFNFIKKGLVILKKLEEDGIDIFVGIGGFSLPLVYYKTKKVKILSIHTLDGENIANIIDSLRNGDISELVDELFWYPFLKLWRVIYLSKADYLIFVSPLAYMEFKKYYWFLRKKSFIIPNGAPEVKLKQKKLKKIYDFAYIGRLDKRKGVDIFVKAIKELVECGYMISVLIHGNGRYRRKVEDLVKKYKLENTIKLIMHTEKNKKILMYMRHTKFVVIPSFYESDSLVVREALAVKTPCIVSNIPPLIEKVKNNKNGFIFKCGDYKDLAEKMKIAIELPYKEYEKLSNYAGRSIKRSWKDVAKSYLKIFRVLQNKKI